MQLESGNNVDLGVLQWCSPISAYGMEMYPWGQGNVSLPKTWSSNEGETQCVRKPNRLKVHCTAGASWDAPGLTLKWDHRQPDDQRICGALILNFLVDLSARQPVVADSLSCILLIRPTQTLSKNLVSLTKVIVHNLPRQPAILPSRPTLEYKDQMR